MCRFFLIFLLLIQFLVTGVNAQNLCCAASRNIEKEFIQADNSVHNIFSLDFKSYETAVLRINQNQEGISALLSQGNNKLNTYEYSFNKRNGIADFYTKTEYVLLKKSHNKFSDLENEICTRAP